METLVNTAIIGTGQVPAAQFGTDLPIDEIIEQLAIESPEQQLLLAAGSASIYQRAGYVPAQFPEQPVVAEPEELPYCSTKVEKHLESLLSATTEASLDTVLQEALHLMQEAHLLLPARLLPLALNLKRSGQKHHALLYPLLGKRGLWLSQFQDAWAWVGQYTEQQSATLTSEKETIWQEGTIEQRQEILRQVREVDPEQARNWLANTWRQERAEVRKVLLNTLEHQLTLADEDFLERALSDRSKEVQKKAAELLAQLPMSAFSQRMQGRAATLLSYQNEHIQITIPETVDTLLDA